MSRPVVSLLLAATVATVAAMSIAAIPELAASADDTPVASVASPTPLTLASPDPAPTGLAPRVVVPQRDQDIHAAPAPEPTPTAAVTTDPDTGAASGALRSRRGTNGLLAAGGTSRDPVDRGGRTVRFSVEVEDGTGLDPDAVAAIVEEALYDGRSWARNHDLRRVAPAEASVRVVVASPAAIDAICREAGLNTAGWLSCWSGSTAAINLDRWQVGVRHFDDLALYRRYVVAHEVGHGLGYGHLDCPGAGRLAPLMQQQTKSLQGCVANEWAFPDA